MATIKRELQHAKWEYDFETNELSLVVLDTNPDSPGPTSIVINKTYTYSLGRFLVRVWQKMASPKRKLKKKLPVGTNTAIANIEQPK